MRCNDISQSSNTRSGLRLVNIVPARITLDNFERSWFPLLSPLSHFAASGSSALG